MSEIVLRNIGQIVSGDLKNPLIDGDTILVRDGLIAYVGKSSGVEVSPNVGVIDCGGAMVMPGYHDNHIHPVIGDWTPRQRAPTSSTHVCMVELPR